MIDYLFGDLLLTSHGVDSDNAASNVEGLGQFGNCRNFIRFGFGFDLPQDQTIVGGPGANHMDARLTIGTIVRAARSFSINGHSIGLAHREGAANPVGKTLGEFLGIEQRENSTECVVGRNSLWQSQKSPEPLLFGPAKANNLNPFVGAANDGAKGYNNDVYELVAGF